MINIYFDRDALGKKGDQVYLRSLISMLEVHDMNFKLVYMPSYTDSSFVTVSLPRIRSVLYSFFCKGNSLKHSLTFCLNTSKVLSSSCPGLIVGLRLASMVEGPKLHQYHLIDLESNKVPYYLPKPLRRMEIIRLKREEARLKNFEKFFVSKRDCLSFPENSYVLPLKKYFSSEYDSNRPIDRVLFWGNLGYFPNEEAIKFLIKLKKYPSLSEIRFTVIGSGLNSGLARKCLSVGIELKGYVENLEEELLKGGVAVFPMSGGGGVQNKFLEAVMLNLPVIFSKEVGMPFDLSSLAVENMEIEIWANEIINLVKSSISTARKDKIQEKVNEYFIDKSSVNQIIKFYEKYIVQS